MLDAWNRCSGALFLICTLFLTEMKQNREFLGRGGQNDRSAANHCVSVLALPGILWSHWGLGGVGGCGGGGVPHKHSFLSSNLWLKHCIYRTLFSFL